MFKYEILIIIKLNSQNKTVQGGWVRGKVGTGHFSLAQSWHVNEDI